jgi:membrane carboxypeptidase/penicillin-binding protein PbpC
VTRGVRHASPPRHDTTDWHVVAPLPHTRYRLHPYLPGEHQRLTAIVAVQDRAILPLQWWLDGAPVTTDVTSTLSDVRASITPSVGRHRLRIRAADGTETTIPFEIVGDTI